MKTKKKKEHTGLSPKSVIASLCRDDKLVCLNCSIINENLYTPSSEYLSTCYQPSLRITWSRNLYDIGGVDVCSIRKHDMSLAWMLGIAADRRSNKLCLLSSICGWRTLNHKIAAHYVFVILFLESLTSMHLRCLLSAFPELSLYRYVQMTCNLLV